ncbi:MAG: hypothetical protein WDN23_07560 [Edaphobacter sp.]
MRGIWVLGCALAIGLAGCEEGVNPRVVTRFNTDAEMTGNLPSNPLAGGVITSWIDRQGGTMSTMFGNDVAVKYARGSADANYPVGAVLQVVTWAQQEDPRWFGGNIPKGTRAVEFVTVTGPGVTEYQRYEGSPLKKVAGVQGVDPASRAAALMGMRAAVMP